MSKTCNSCGTDKAPANMLYAVHEEAMARAERTQKSLVLLIVLLIFLLVGTNGAWLWYESQFEVVEETTETITYDVVQDGLSTNNSIINGGEIGGTEN